MLESSKKSSSSSSSSRPTMRRTISTSRSMQHIQKSIRTNFVHEEDDCSWEDLQRIEKIRRNIMRQGVKPFCGVLFQWSVCVLFDDLLPCHSHHFLRGWALFQ